MKLENIYDEWYSAEYMDDWPTQKKNRVFDLIKNMELPLNGNAIDFGCGQGVFTAIIKKALPNWNIYGTDISKVAISKASLKNPMCKFIIYDDLKELDVKFDFIFSHHVLEHVIDLSLCLDQINQLASAKTFMLHILPCGNKGSLEYKLCSYVLNGIQSDAQGRFFFEENLHLRRLNSNNLISLFKKYEFRIAKQFYSNQYFGALMWISRMPKDFVFNVTNYHKSKNTKAYLALLYYRFIFYLMYILQRPFFKPHKNIVLYFISSLIKNTLDSLSNLEWRYVKQNMRGSEMYLFFKR